MQITGQNHIGSKLHGSGSHSFHGVNPSNQQTLDPAIISSTAKEVDQAVELAKNAFGIYRDMAGIKKADFLEEIALQILDLGEQLTSRACEETGLPEGRIQGETGRTVNQLRMFAELLREGTWVEASIDTAIPDRSPLPRADIRKILIPMGPIVVFGAANFPLAFSTAGGDTASALAAGNPVIVKGHPSHPGTSELVAGAIIKAAEITGLPNGVFSHLQDDRFDVGTELVRHPGVKAVAFTGSFVGGQALQKVVNQRSEPIPFFAEMGSVNPIIVLPGAMKERPTEIARMFSGSVTLGAGQFCTNPGVILGIKGDGMIDLQEELKVAIQSAARQTMLNEGIYANFQRTKQQVVRSRGVTVISESIIGVDQEPNNAVPLVAKVKATDFLSNNQLQKEVFGPFSMMVEVESEEELQQILDQMEGQLTVSIMSNAEDISRFGDLLSGIREKAGRVIFNGVPTGVEVCHSMTHGGPFPATSDSRFTSVGTAAIKRFVRPISYQDCPEALLPKELWDHNPGKIMRQVNGEWTREELRQ